MIRKYVVTLEDTLQGWQEDEDELERKYGAEPLDCGNCEIVQASISTGIKTASRLVDDELDNIKGYIDHIRNTGMGKKKSLEFIEKFIERLQAESED